MKRAVFGFDGGSSTVLIDAAPPERERSDRGGMVSREVWSTIGPPTVATEDRTLDLPINGMVNPGETRFRVVTFSAQHTSPMHRTRTIDYGVILSGSVDVLMEDGSSAHLETGDCLVQLGAMHAWRNASDQPVTIAFVMVGAERPV